MEDARTFSADELCTLGGITRRTLRYYVTLGLVDRPQGETRGAYYTASHLEQVLEVKKLSDGGLSLEAIREMREGVAVPMPVRLHRPGSIAVRSHVYLAPGIELQIDPEAAGLTPEEVRSLAREVSLAAERLLSRSQEREQEKEREKERRGPAQA